VSAGGGQEGSRTYGLNFTEPYFLGYRLAVGFDLNHSETSSNDNYDYEENSVVLRAPRRSPKIWRRRSATTTSR
jgi:outer membrane protein insertion porin family